MRTAPFYACTLLCAAAFAASGQVVLDPDLEFEEIVSGLQSPTAMAFIGADDILVLQKNDALDSALPSVCVDP